ncbi:MAG: RDD family protein [Planctomycetota bacterium]|jgi:uncharacterized RDD family membrane protein YckC
MDFLPITLSGERVYAGFWKRLCAGFADAFIVVPLVFLFVWLEGFDRTLAILITIPSSILFAMYSVYFNARFGGTPGKLAVGIRIAKPNGMRIGWPEAWKRSAVDLVFAFLVLVFQVWALLHVDPEHYSSLGWIERTDLLHEHQPSWFNSVTILQQVWIWSEVVVLLFNKRKRAIHDFIAGTVVIKKEFAEQDDGQLSSGSVLADEVSS